MGQSKNSVVIILGLCGIEWDYLDPLEQIVDSKYKKVKKTK